MRLAVGIGAITALLGLGVIGSIRLLRSMDSEELADLAWAFGFALLISVVIPGLVFAAVWGLGV